MSKSIVKKVAFIFIASLALSFVSVTHAVNISLSFPGVNYSTSTPPGTIVNGFYQFALLIGGILAFGAIVYGGVRYMTSAGNPSGQHEAKEWILSALIGIILLVGAYLILNTVNPNLTHLDLPTLQPVNISNNGYTGNGGSNGQGTSGSGSNGGGGSAF